MSALSQSKEYVSFRRSVPLQQKMVEGAQAKGAKAWRLYDFGPKQVRCPIVFLPTAGGTAESYFKQLMGLGSLGYRVVAVDYPPYWTHIEWCDGFTKLLDQLGFEKVHLFGTALGGFLAQVYAQQRTKRIESLILCNTFINTDAFRQNAPYMGLCAPVSHAVAEHDERSPPTQVQLGAGLCAQAHHPQQLSLGRAREARGRLGRLYGRADRDAVAARDRVAPHAQLGRSAPGAGLLPRQPRDDHRDVRRGCTARVAAVAGAQVLPRVALRAAQVGRQLPVPGAAGGRQHAHPHPLPPV
eukprot:Unigene14497_Nuclearia_a/m.43685 Unigene14497_Nuclearia_a/g.43685  ORF Unigene14497_Nuclearia_a/g.43685 Unigene14497_Nuclearia_a/m.43685 type:complete len:298 (-) Unigene14497_Nuclearia_a:144-1037(-)